MKKEVRVEESGTECESILYREQVIEVLKRTVGVCPNKEVM